MPDVTNYHLQAELAACTTCTTIMREMAAAPETAQLALRHVGRDGSLVVDLALRDIDRALTKYRGEE